MTGPIAITSVDEADALRAAIRREEKRSRSRSRTDSTSRIRCELWPLWPVQEANAPLDGPSGADQASGR